MNSYVHLKISSKPTACPGTENYENCYFIYFTLTQNTQNNNQSAV